MTVLTPLFSVKVLLTSEVTGRKLLPISLILLLIVPSSFQLLVVLDYLYVTCELGCCCLMCKKGSRVPCKRSYLVYGSEFVLLIYVSSSLVSPYMRFVLPYFSLSSYFSREPLSVYISLICLCEDLLDTQFLYCVLRFTDGHKFVPLRTPKSLRRKPFQLRLLYNYVAKISAQQENVRGHNPNPSV